MNIIEMYINKRRRHINIDNVQHVEIRRLFVDDFQTDDIFSYQLDLQKDCDIMTEVSFSYNERILDKILREESSYNTKIFNSFYIGTPTGGFIIEEGVIDNLDISYIAKDDITLYILSKDIREKGCLFG